MKSFLGFLLTLFLLLALAAPLVAVVFTKGDMPILGALAGVSFFIISIIVMDSVGNFVKKHLDINP